MKEYKKYVLGGLFICFMAVALMTPIEKSEAFWPFGKAKKENNANYTGAVANTESNKIKPAPSITVVSPNGGEVIQGGKNFNIKWKSKGFDKQAIIAITLLQTKGETETGTVIAENLNNKGSYLWKVPVNISGNDFLIQINIKGKNTSSWDMSDGFFSIAQKEQNKELKVIQGEQPMATIFPQGSFLPFNNFIVNPQGKQIALSSVRVGATELLDGKLLYVMLVVKKINGGDKGANFYEGKTIARGTINGSNELRLIPNMANFSFNQPVEFSVVGVRGHYGEEDDLKDGSIMSVYVTGIQATDLKTNNNLVATGLPIKGTSHKVDNSLKVGSVSYQELTDLSNEGYVLIEVPSVSSDKAILKSFYLEVGKYWDVNKKTAVTVKNNSNVFSFDCSGIFNSMVKCLFDKDILIDRGTALNITVNQKGGISRLPWHDLFIDGYASKYRLYPQTGRACFLAGTKIDMADGARKNIEEIKISDYVKSLDTETGKINNAKVVKVIKKIDPSHLTLNNLLKTVPDQKMFTKEGFKQAKDLKIGDYLLSNDNNWIKIYDISPIVNESVETYDLVLEGGNTFYSDGYLAHSVEE